MYENEAGMLQALLRVYELLNAMSGELVLTTARKLRRNGLVYSEWTQAARTNKSNSKRQEGIRYGKASTARISLHLSSPDH